MKQSNIKKSKSLNKKNKKINSKTLIKRSKSESNLQQLNKIISKKSKSPKSKSKSPKSSQSKFNNTKSNTKSDKNVKRINKLVTIDINEDTDISNYLPSKPSDMIVPKTWELRNRKTFYEWLHKNFGKYEMGNPKKLSKIMGEGIHPSKDRPIPNFQLQPIQKIVRDFMQTESPYRGILLYFGLGVGKTISAISISEAIHNKKGVLVFSKTSLEPNFISGGPKKAGQDIMIKESFWNFTTSNNRRVLELANQLGIPEKIINDNGGLFIVDTSKNYSNYSYFSQSEKQMLEKQIDTTVKNRFTFHHTDNPRLMGNLNQDMFHNKIIIIDEVHNEINSMTKKTSAKYKLYEYFMNAKNSKFVFLTGTPIINKPYEASVLFNILRGHIEVLEYNIKSGFGDNIDFGKIKSNLKLNKNIDQIVVNKINKIIKITKNPDGYLNSMDPKHLGVEYCLDSSNPRNRMLMNIEEVKEYCDRIIKGLGYKFICNKYNETALPESEEEFEQKFYNRDLNKIKKIDVFKKRIANLTSYYKYRDPKSFPRLNFIKNVMCPMNDYQLGIYEKIRHEEIQHDTKSARKKKGDDDVTSSSYRIASRMACSFVYPEDMPNPYDIGYKLELYEQQVEAEKKSLARKGKAVYDEDYEVDVDNEKKIALFIKQNLLKTLVKKKSRYLSLDNGSLQKHSPKYANMIKNVNESCKKGKALLYSNFKKLIGLNLFSVVMEASGLWEEFIIKKIDNEWHLITSNPEYSNNNKHKSVSSLKKSMSKTKKDTKKDTTSDKLSSKEKMRYVFFSGEQKGEEKYLIPLIFNGKLDALPSNCEPLKRQIRTYFGEEASRNLRGDVIKCLLTTRTGAEGLDLKCVRSVHVSEPYWQPVLIEQIIGRAVRTNSHIELPEKDRDVDVYIYMSTITPNMVQNIKNPDVRTDMAKYNEGLNKKGKVVTSDEALFILSARKKVVADQVLQMIKDTAFDCTLTYGINKIQSPDIVCLDYETKDRDDYLFTPSIDDTIDIIDIKQEYQIVDKYIKKTIKGVEYAIAINPSSNGKQYIYPITVLNTVRIPKPVGEIIKKDGKLLPALYKKKT